MDKDDIEKVALGYHGFGDRWRAKQLESYGCAGDVECAQPMDGNCDCFNRVLASYLQEQHQ